MTKSLRRDFHAKVFNNINAFIKIVDGLAGQKDLQDAFAAAPRILKNGRTIPQIIMDDLMNAFATVMRDIPDAEIPTSFYQQILSTREGKAVADEDADKHLAALIAGKRADGPDDIRAPEFLALFNSAIPGDVVSNLVNNWISVVSTFGRLTHSEDALTATQKSQEIIQHVMSVHRQLRKIQKEQSETISRIAGETSGAPVEEPAEEDTEKAGILAKLAKKIRLAHMSPEATERAKKELGRLKLMSPQASEYSVLTSYLDVLTSLPWDKFSTVNRSLRKTEAVLNEDHYGMQKVKDAIVEHVAVQNRTGKTSGRMLLLVGPPGIGKTSIARSVATATGRKFVRVSLGGVSDEAKIRGHIITYVGAKPGALVKAMISAGTKNPLILLDEIDKLGHNRMQGDPAAALLEALDPEQNYAFKDHYLDVEFDLSNVMFLCTANDFGNIPGPLLDRMKVIHLPVYLHDEKFEIAKRYLMPKQIEKNGLKPGELTITDTTLRELISDYTREAGVRGLENMINTLCCKAVVKFAKGRKTPITVTPDNLETYAGVSKEKHDQVHSEDEVGVVNGLAYTSVGGCRLPIQSVTIPSNGFRITATGRLGEVMRESIHVADRLVRSQAAKYQIPQETLNSTEIGLHAPEGAVPKDGPSAGLAMATVIISALTGSKIRHDLAMTGEIDLKGNARKIGGLPEKLEGALRAGVKTVLIPRDNVCDLSDIPNAIKSHLTIIPVDTIDDVLKHALVAKPAAPILTIVPSTPASVTPDAQPAAAGEKDDGNSQNARSLLSRLANRLFFGQHGNDNTPPEVKKAVGRNPSAQNGPQ